MRDIRIIRVSAVNGKETPGAENAMMLQKERLTALYRERHGSVRGKR